MQHLLLDFISKYVTFSEEEKSLIGSSDVFRSAKKGTYLLREGDRSNQNYFVLKGCIRSYYLIDGEEKTTAFYTEMQGVTPNCVSNDEVSEYYIKCLEDTIYTVSTPELESDMFDKYPIFEKLCRLVSEDLLAKEQASFDEFKTSSPEMRYLKLLENRPNLIQRVPQIYLASYLGITPQSLSRIKNRLFKNSSKQKVFLN